MAETQSASTIVVGVDDSPEALTALRWADDRLALLNAEGTSANGVVMVAWSPPAVGLKAVFDDRPLKAAASELLERCCQELGSADKFERRVVKGSAANAILSEAAELGADLIVIGSRGRSAIAQLLLGSVSRHVAAAADRPVAIIPHPKEDDGSTTVVAYDGSIGAKAAVRWALENVSGPITVVTAWSLPATFTYDPTDLNARALEAATEQDLTTGLKEICGGTIDERLQPIVTHGDPRLVILDPLLDARQIVIGQRGHQGISGVLLGSTVNYIAGHSQKPVIVVPATEPSA